MSLLQDILVDSPDQLVVLREQFRAMACGLLQFHSATRHRSAQILRRADDWGRGTYVYSLGLYYTPV